MKRLWHKIPTWAKNKYFVTACAFFFWLLLFDQNDLISQYKLKAELNRLQEDKNYYQQEIKQVETTLDELLTDNQKLEKLAREKYYMKKENEDIFVLVESDQPFK